MKLTKEMILAKSGSFDLDAVFYLSLAKLSIDTIEPVINSCSGLETLDLSHNSLSSSELSVFSGRSLSRLRSLTLCCNRISSVRPLANIPTLKALYLQGNSITNMDDIALLGKRCGGLRVLYLKELNGSCANQVCSVPDYRSTILSFFPNLKVLDGERVQRRDCVHKLMEEIRVRFPSAEQEKDLLKKLAEEGKQKSSWVSDADVSLVPSSSVASHDTSVKAAQALLSDCQLLDSKCDEMIASLPKHIQQMWAKELGDVQTGSIIKG